MKYSCLGAMKAFLSIQTVLETLFQNRQWQTQWQLQTLIARWPDLVGPDLSQTSAPAALRGQTLWIYVSQAVWAQELLYRQGELLNKLKPAMPLQTIRGIRCLIEPSWFQKKEAPEEAGEEDEEQMPESFQVIAHPECREALWRLWRSQKVGRCSKIQALSTKALSMPDMKTPQENTQSAPEMVCIVDRENNPVGTLSRKVMRQYGLIHRASYILVRNQLGEIFVHKRTPTKDVFPGFWDIAAGGVVQAGETYEASARRELWEELGISAPLTFLFDHFYDGLQAKVWGRIFTCWHEGPFTLQKEEIEEGRFFSVADIFALDRTEQLTPDGVEILARLEREKPDAWVKAAV